MSHCLLGLTAEDLWSADGIRGGWGQKVLLMANTPSQIL